MHVMDSDHIELFQSFGPPSRSISPPCSTTTWAGKDLQFPTKFMLLELFAAVIVAALYIPLAWRMRSGELPSGWQPQPPRGAADVRPRRDRQAGHRRHDADKYVPFLWTMFLFILFNNLLGLIPFFGSATGNIYVTAGLALCVFFAIHGSAVRQDGLRPLTSVSMWPHFDVPYGLGYILKPLIFLLEWMGVLVRNAVLAVRLFANMFAGHVVLAMLLIFISRGRRGEDGFALWGGVTVGQRAGAGGPEPAGAVRRLPAGVHLHVPGGAVHGHGDAPGPLRARREESRPLRGLVGRIDVFWAAVVASYWEYQVP